MSRGTERIRVYNHQMRGYTLKTNKDELIVADLMQLNESVGSRPRLIEKWERALTFSPYVAFALDEKGNLLGFGRLEQNEPVILLYDMCVQPDMQGRGVGTLVLESLLTQARNAGILTIGLSAWTSMAREFYLKHGFIDSNANADLKDYMEISLWA